MPFCLTKWYLDCVTARGEAHLGYAAELAVGPVKLRHASLLSASPQRAPVAHTRVRGAALPELHGGEVRWAVPSLVRGAWTAGTPGMELELLDPPGALTWRCLHPRASANVSVGHHRARGVGYVEVVELRVPPWRLPIDELRWGRAHLGGHSVVWLDWRGPRRLRRVFLDGAAVDGEVEDEWVRAGPLTVALTRARTLREGEVAQTALARLPAVRRLLSRHRLRLEEVKWLSRATAGAARGWAIHEVVRWR